MNNFDIPLAVNACSTDDLAKLQVFEKILKGNVEAILITDTRGDIEWVNNTFTAITGYPESEALDRNLGFLFAGGNNEYAALYPKLGEVNHHVAETHMFRKDGSKFPANVTLSAVRSSADMITHYVLEFSDITEFKHAQDELQQRTRELSRSNQELEQFAYVASHDLQEPLRMVASYTQLIAQRYRGKLDKDADEFIEFAVDGATRMQAIINDLLMLSRVGTRNVAFTRTDVKQSLDKALANLRLVIAESGADIVCEALLVLDADGSQLTQLFQNLIGNALKFRGDRAPQIKIGAVQQDGDWQFHVRDNGIGIAPEHFERIFLMFQRLHGKREYPGTGIGLTICKKIVERHGGRIWIESEAGKGTTFLFTIPIQQAE
ncbi:MAG: PAS domain S-box protein [Gammaproteobacteria bacterium]|nr:PAS domain S-box protein [Gammaproteobacteria bacterium]MBU1968581.1 PAS domain S-box protein [Gammaproteobacteria bacterium]